MDRQAVSTIKGYQYQFLKSIYEVLKASENEEVILEGALEDIDIISGNSTKFIQCKYHEALKFSISSIISPVLELICDYLQCLVIGKDKTFILYAHFQNEDYDVKKEDILNYINTTKSRDILINFFHKLYQIPDNNILELANKVKKTYKEKEDLYQYYVEHRSTLKLKMELNGFWDVFHYEKAHKLDNLICLVKKELGELTDDSTVENLYYPNALTIVSTLSCKNDINERKLTKRKFVDELKNKKTILFNKWSIEICGRNNSLKKIKKTLARYFEINSDVRCFLFSKDYIYHNSDKLFVFVNQYLNKYFKKRKLQKPPIFIFDTDNDDTINEIQQQLYDYQKTVSNGIVGAKFCEKEFIECRNCSNYSCRICNFKNIDVNLLKECKINYLFVIGYGEYDLKDSSYTFEKIEIGTINELQYITNLTNVLEV